MIKVTLFQKIVSIAHDKRAWWAPGELYATLVEHFTRHGEEWILRMAEGLEAIMPLPAMGCELPLQTFKFMHLISVGGVIAINLYPEDSDVSYTVAKAQSCVSRAFAFFDPRI